LVAVGTSKRPAPPNDRGARTTAAPSSFDATNVAVGPLPENTDTCGSNPPAPTGVPCAFVPPGAPDDPP